MLAIGIEGFVPHLGVTDLATECEFVTFASSLYGNRTNRASAILTTRLDIG